MDNKIQPRPALQGQKVGRPAGSRTRDIRERIKLELPAIYRSQLAHALAGDAESARFCVDVVNDPEKYPMPDVVQEEV